MLHRSTTLLTISIFLSFLCVGTTSGADRVILHPAIDGASFDERWNWGLETSRAEGGAWVGWSLDHWTEPDHHHFSGSLTVVGNRYVVRGEPLAALLGDAEPTASATTAAPPRPGMERRAVAVLVAFDRHGDVVDVNANDFEFPARLKGRPLVWIGAAPGAESLRILTELYERTSSTDAREDLVEAVGLCEEEAAVDFLAGVLDSDASTPVREEAAEALGENIHPRVLAVLIATARGDRSTAVREEAIEALAHRAAPDRALELFKEIVTNDKSADIREEALEAIAEMPEDVSLPILIEVARHHPSASTREEAVDLLAEKAGERVVGTLEDIVYQDTNRSVREEALDVLGELPNGAGLAVLVKVARTHPSASMREAAIDVLGDVGEEDPRAREALLSLISD